MKKDKEWAIKEAKETINGFFDRSSRGVAQHYEDELIASIADIINQLDEPEVLSQEWIDEHRKSYTMEDSVEISDLQNLLVPKQEEMKISKMWHDVIAQNKEEGHSLRWTLNCIDNLNVNDVDGFAKAWLAYPNIKVEEEQKYLLKHNGEYLKSVKVQTYHNRESLDELGIHLSYTVKEYAQIFTKEQKEHIEKYLNVEVEELEQC